MTHIYTKMELQQMSNSEVQNSSTTSSCNDAAAEDGFTNIKPHPLGVKPSGNALTSDRNLCDSMGWFGKLPDDLLLSLLEWLDASSLRQVGSSCRGLFAYTTYDQLWRDLCVRSEIQLLKWRGSWRASVLQLPSPELPEIKCDNLFSDALHRPFLCSQVSLQSFFSNIPPKNRIPKMSDLTLQDFAQDWSDMPFILTDLVKRWPIYRSWQHENFLQNFKETKFRAEAVDWALSTYFEYMSNTNDESPLYLFDRSFVSKMKLEVGPNGAYWPPECFGEDLFDLLGPDRPDYRWLIVGPERSGSTFHKDPNATSAWNAVIQGSKYWIMFPASVTPPGVFMSEDQSEVTSPLSIAEWLLTFHEEARITPGCLEGICSEGEVLHVPSGWWHLVVNLEPAVAITQNFVPKSHLKAAIKFLKDKPDQVSGFSYEIMNPHELFIQKLTVRHPELLPGSCSANLRKRKWEDVVNKMPNDEFDRPKAFSFGFATEDENEEIP